MKVKQPTYRSIWKLAAPAMVGGIVEPVLSLTDLAVVGHIGSETMATTQSSLVAVAAVGVSGSLISALIWIFAQMKSAISAVVSQAYGANKMKNMASLIPQMIFFNAVVGCITLAGALFTSEWIFTTVLSVDEAILSDATTYFNIRVWGFPLTLITFSIFGVFRGIQNTSWAMIVSIVGGSVNVILDVMLVLGWGNVFPPMGVEGAAIASVIAQISMFLLVLYYLFVHSKIRMALTHRINPQFNELLLISGNLIIRTLILNITLLVTHKFANIYGTTQAATHAVVLNLWLFSAFFLDAFASSANAQGGMFLGSSNYEAMQRNLSRHLMLSCGVAVLLAIVITLFDQPIMGLIIDNPKVESMYPAILPLFAVCLVVNAFAFTLDGIYKGMGKAKFLRNLLFISSVLGFLPVLLIGHYTYPSLQIIWYAIIVWMIFRGIIPLLYFRKIVNSKLPKEQR